MEDLIIYKKRAIRNVFLLIFRSGFLQLINFVGAFTLTILLAPSIFGIFAVVSAIINFLNYFSDIGLAAALVQKKEEVETQELQCIFTIQQLLVILLCVIALIFSSFVQNLYKLDTNGMLLFFALLASFFLSSLKTIPSILLERELQFEKLVIPQIIEALFFNVTAVVLASQGMGALAFAWAVFLRGLSGLIVLYLIKPWKIGFNFNFFKYKMHFRFGVPFQLNSLLAMIKDDLLVVFLGKILTFAQVGFIGWGQKWAFMPLRFILDNVAKISFSAFSRIQDDKENLNKAVNKALFGTSFLTFPILVMINVAARYLVVVIPRYQKWIPALPFLTYFSLNAAMACVFITLVNLFNSRGKVKLTLNLMIFWTILSWVLNIALIYAYGPIGVGISSLLMGIASLVTLYYAKNMVKIDYWNFILPGIAAGITLFIVFVGQVYIPKNYMGMMAAVIFSGIIYLFISFLFFGKRLKSEIIFLIHNLK
jgi:O-antigen/teichoic acid export membrane protein